MSTARIDEAKLESFVNSVVSELGATLNAALVRIGDELGLYRAMAGAGGLTPADLARRTSTVERYVREWLAAQAAGGYVEYDPETGRYTLPPEQAAALADEQSPFFMLGGFEVASACMADEPMMADAFRTGEGVGWHEHDHRLFEGTGRFFRPSYRAHLVTEWIPALDGVEERLEVGGRVADVGCGHGASTVLMAQAYPGSVFIGVAFEAGFTRFRRAAETPSNLVLDAKR